MKKEQLIDAAKNLFMKYGIRSVSMDDVCRQVGISKKTLYEHIDTKAELVDLAVQAQCEEETDFMNNMLKENDDALEIMVNIGRYIIQMVKGMKPGVMYDLQKYYGAIYTKWDKEHSEFIHDHLMDNMKLGIKQGYYRPDIDTEVIARLYVGKTRMVMDETVFPSKQFKQEHVVRTHFFYHLHGILTEKGVKKLYSENLLNKKLEA